MLGGVPGKVLADRMGCLKGGVVANVVVPTAAYVRFAAIMKLFPWVPGVVCAPRSCWQRLELPLALA